MKQIEVMFLKNVKILGVNQNIPVFAKQIINTDEGVKLNIPVPVGYQIVSITEILPLIIQKDENPKN